MRYSLLIILLLVTDVLSAQSDWKKQVKEEAKIFNSKTVKGITGDLCYIPSGTCSDGYFSGSDSFNYNSDLTGANIFSCSRSSQRAFMHFYTRASEVSNAEYRRFWLETHNMAVKPDTLIFIRDFPSAYNDPLSSVYFWHPKYDPYPVVGVTYDQTVAFCRWQQDKLNALLKAEGDDKYQFVVRIPTLWEWEYMYAVSGDDEAALRTNKGYAANYGSVYDAYGYAVKQYADDGYLYPAPAGKFPSSHLQIFNLRGNVAEYVCTRSDTLIDMLDAMLRDTLPQPDKRVLSSKNAHDAMIIREIINARTNIENRYGRDAYLTKGGTWAHTTFYSQGRVNLFVKPSESHSWVGFRPVYFLVPQK